MSRTAHDVALSYYNMLEEAYNNGELYDYLDSALDLEFTMGSTGNYLGASICVALGGPTVYINTRDNRIEAYWGGEQSYISLDSDIAGEIDAIYEDYFYSLR